MFDDFICKEDGTRGQYAGPLLRNSDFFWCLPFDLIQRILGCMGRCFAGEEKGRDGVMYFYPNLLPWCKAILPAPDRGKSAPVLSLDLLFRHIGSPQILFKY